MTTEVVPEADPSAKKALAADHPYKVYYKSYSSEGENWNLLSLHAKVYSIRTDHMFRCNVNQI